MGNQLATQSSKPGVEHSAELLNVVFKETLGPGRLLKSLLCLHDNGGLVVVKVFDKRKDINSLAVYKQQLEAIRNALLGLPCLHVWPMQLWWETPNAGYMMRQHFSANLYERLSTRPFLTALEKRWITFQLLQALSQAHAHGVCHGDIKAENVMVTSWNWVFLTDFASYKPTYLPADNPADFSYYFDTGGRRRCYLAPERFFEGSPAAINTAAPMQPDMDVFSLGCVIAELWLGEGRAFFDLGTLLAYRRGEYDPSKELAAIEPDIAELVLHMIQRAPGDRWSADHYSTSWPRQLFPHHFSDVLHPFFGSLLGLDPDARLAAVAARYSQLAAAVQGTSPGSELGSGSPALLPSAVKVLSSPRAAGPAVGEHSSSPRRSQLGSGAGPSPAVPAGGVKAAAIAGVVPGAGAAASSQLLAGVDDLLVGAGSIQQRLAGPGASGMVPSAAEDDGICIDDMSQEAGSELAALLPGQLQQPATTAGAPASQSSELPAVLPGPADGGGSGAHELVSDVWWEHQVRGPDSQWIPHVPVGTSSSKDEVSLPAGSGWYWVGDWQLQGGAAAGAGSSSEGWWYSHEPPDVSEAWTTTHTDNSRWRRRPWSRQRARLSSTAAGSSKLTAAAAVGDSRQEQPLEHSSAAAAWGQVAGGQGGVVSRDQGMVLLAVLLCTLLRGSRLQESKRAAMMLLCCAGLRCDDEVRLQTVVPYLLTQLSDPHAAVRTLALHCVVQLMASLSRLPPADARVYNDYLLPSLSLLPNDPEESVRVAYAQALAQLAAAAHRHLLGMQYGAAAELKPTQQAHHQLPTRQPTQQRSRSGSGGADTLQAAGVGPAAAAAGAHASGAGGAPGASSSSSVPAVRYDAEMEAVRSAIEKVVLELVAGLKSSPDIKRGLLSHAGQLGLFFGRRATTDQLLPPLYTCLNDHIEWRLRSSFYGAIAALGPHTGHLDIFMLPYLEQALHDSQPAVACDALRCWAAVCHHLPKRSLLKAVRQVVHLLSRNSAAVRHAAVAFISAVARALPPADAYAQLAAMVAGRLQQQPLLLTDEEHLAACLHPVKQPASPTTHSLQHCPSASLLQPHVTLHQQLTGSSSSPAHQELPVGRRRVTLGAAEPGVEAGQYNSGGGLLLRPSHGPLQHSMSERPSSRGGGAPARLSLAGSGIPQPSTPRLREDFNTDGSTLLLRPSAPVYCCDLDPAALGGVGSPAAHTAAGSVQGSDATTSSLPSFGAPDWSVAAAAGVAGIGSRCGYRADGFGSHHHSSNAGGDSSTKAQPDTARPTGVDPGVAVSGLAVPPDVHSKGAASTTGVVGAAAKTTATRPGAAKPGQFWPSSSLGAVCGAGGRRGMLTGFNTQLAVGPGGLVIGPSAAGSGMGLRPRPKSSHTAAVESIAKRQAVLQEQYNSLDEVMSRDPGSVEAADKQQMERLATTLYRLNLQPGHDVRCPAALLTYKMAAITSRTGPTSTLGPGGEASSSVYDAVSAAMTTGIGQHLPGSSSGLDGPAGGGSNPSWRPRGVLASHLMEHRAAVNCLATSNNGALLLSGSDDETVKVWDIRRLERDVSFASRLTYAGQSGRITSVCAVLDGGSVASASSSGSLHVWRVEYTSKPGGWAPDKYRGITAVRQLSPGEGAILQVLPWANHPALLLYTSQRGGVHCCDLRCAKDAWHVPPAPSLGLVQQLVADPSGQHWLAQGTSRGWVCLWDVRFLLCVNSWQHPQRCSIQSMAAAVAAPPRLGLAAGSLPHAGVPLLYIAAGLQEVGLWDVLDGQCHQVLRVLSREESHLHPAEPPAALQPPLPSPAAQGSRSAGGGPPGGAGVMGSAVQAPDADQVAAMLDAHMAVDQINTPQPRLASISSLLPLANGALVTGGADRCIRYWEPSWPERSYIVAGPVWPDDTGIMEGATNKLQVPAHAYRYGRHLCKGVPVVEERCLGEGPRLVTPDCSPDLSSKLRMQDLAHSDSITQLEAVQGVSRLLVSGSRDGCIKVWK